VLRKIGSHYYASDSAVREVLNLAAALVVRFGRKLPAGKTCGDVTCTFGKNCIRICAEPSPDTTFRNWALV
jgi:hypothetical protein